MKKNPKKYMLLIAIIIITISIISCREKETIKIGLSSAFSGPNSEIGVSLRDGFLLKVEEINELGGINGSLIEVIIRDDKNDLEMVKKIDREFIEKGVDVIFGHELSFKASSILEATRGEDILVISPTIATSKISRINDNFIRTMPSNFDQGVSIGNYAIGKNKKILIVYDARNAEFASGTIKGFSSVFGDNIIFFSIYDDLKKYEENILQSYNDMNFDGVLCITNPSDLVYLSQIFFKNEIDLDIYSSSWGVVSSTLKNASKSVEGVAYVTLLEPKKSPKYIEFRDKYFKKYKREPEFTSAYSYEAASLLFDSIDKIDDLTYKNLKDAILSSGDQNGIVSDYTIDKYGDVIRKLNILIVKDGKMEID